MYQVDVMQQVLRQIPYPMFWKDTEGIYLGCSADFARLAGLPEADDIIGKTDRHISWPYSQAALFLASDREVLEYSQVILQREEDIVGVDGRHILAVMSKVPLKDAAGHIIGLIGSYIDVTEFRKLQAGLGERVLELERFQVLSVDREFKMISLKKEINALAKEMNRPAVYDLSFLERLEEPV